MRYSVLWFSAEDLARSVPAYLSDPRQDTRSPTDQQRRGCSCSLPLATVVTKTHEKLRLTFPFGVVGCMGDQQGPA